MASTLEKLISQDSIFISNGKTSDEVFADISSQLYGMGLVRQDFLENIIMREHEYPTGMDLTVVNEQLPGIAIPHTESGFVNSRRIVPIKLTNDVEFNNMINPSEKIKVRFLFMILNNDPEGQANILSEIMGFVTSADIEDLQELFNTNSKEVIFDKLKNKFK